jgi:hypothetical protein
MNGVNVKKLKRSFVSYKYPCKQVILIKLSERIQSLLLIYCLFSFSFSLVVYVCFPIFNNGKLEFASFGKEVLKELKEMEKVVVNGVLIAKYWYI